MNDVTYEVFDEAEQAEHFTQMMTDKALQATLSKLPPKNAISSILCHECEGDIPEARRIAYPGVKTCIDCQTLIEQGKL